jgi:hypothetical protein
MLLVGSNLFMSWSAWLIFDMQWPPSLDKNWDVVNLYCTLTSIRKGVCSQEKWRTLIIRSRYVYCWVHVGQAFAETTPGRGQQTYASNKDVSSGFGLPTSFRPDECVFEFIFTLTGWTRTWPAQNQVRMRVSFFTRGCTRNPKKTRNPKNPESDLKTLKGTRTKHEKTPNLRKTPMETQKKLERNTFTKFDGHPKPDGFGFRCQFSPSGVDSGVKFNPTSFFSQVRFLVNLIRIQPIAIPSKQAKYSADRMYRIDNQPRHRLGSRGYVVPVWGAPERFGRACGTHKAVG